MATTQQTPSALPGQRYGSFAGRGPVVEVDGVRTALHEQIGNSVVATINSNYRLRLPYGYGGARFYVLTPTVAGLVVTLPRIDYCSEGGIPSATVANVGAFDLVVFTHEGDFVSTIVAGGCESYRIAPSGPTGGGWLAKSLGTARVGSMLVDRVPVDVRITESSLVPFDLRARARAMGFPDEHPAYAVQCTIAAGVVVGSNSTAVPAFSSGIWPANSTLLLVLEAGAWIAGAGGRGGRGGDVPPGLLAQPGQVGGHGLRIDVDTALVSFGIVQGGGGGGGGGPYASTTPGAGGGGGAGYAGGAGGASGNHTAGGGYVGGEGHAGAIGYPGGGGWTPASSGAYGGLPGAAGSASGAAGGGGGAAIRKHGGATLNKVRAGTINGAEVVVP